MIHLTCTSCKKVLSIDDGFAGGVCRCQQCGTIQTVPSHLKHKTAQAVGTATPAVSEPLYQNKARVAATGSGLDQLADIVASSGLAGTGLSHLRPTPAKAGAVPPQKQPAILIGAIAGGAVLLGMLITWLAMRGGGTAPPRPALPPMVQQPAAPASREPGFLGMKITVPSVIYVLDRGTGTQETFAAMREAAVRSLASLGPDRRFQVIFWDVDGELIALPEEGMQPASEQRIAAVVQRIQGIGAYGASSPVSALRKALAAKPAAIFFASGKWGLDSDLAQILDVVKDSRVPIHTFCLNPAAGSPKAMQDIATKTGGTYSEVTPRAAWRLFAVGGCGRALD